MFTMSEAWQNMNPEKFLAENPPVDQYMSSPDSGTKLIEEDIYIKNLDTGEYVRATRINDTVFNL